jgi:hypothetical protein
MAEADKKHPTVHQRPTEDESATSEVSMIQVFSKKGITLSWITLLVIALMNYFDGIVYNTFQIYAVSEYNRLSIEGALTTAAGIVTMGRRPQTHDPRSNHSNTTLCSTPGSVGSLLERNIVRRIVFLVTPTTNNGCG